MPYGANKVILVVQMIECVLLYVLNLVVVMMVVVLDGGIGAEMMLLP
jgi:hypothetical protein